MKKVIAMLLMMVATMFASPLFALDESPPAVEKTNSAEDIVTYGENGLASEDTVVYGKSNPASADVVTYDKNGLSLIGAGHADDIIFVKVNILHKDSLMYSWGEGIDNKLPGISGGYKHRFGSDRIDVAVVCHLRGVAKLEWII